MCAYETGYYGADTCLLVCVRCLFFFFFSETTENTSINTYLFVLVKSYTIFHRRFKKQSRDIHFDEQLLCLRIRHIITVCSITLSNRRPPVDDFYCSVFGRSRRAVIYIRFYHRDGNNRAIILYAKQNINYKNIYDL